MPKPQIALIPLLLTVSGGVLAQKPVIKPNGVVNAASYAGSVKGEALVVGGAIFSIFGENLAASEVKAPGAPLPTTLAGTSVTVGGIAAPLFYVSPGQINFQVPLPIRPLTGQGLPRVGERVPVVVTTPAGASDPVLAYVQDDSSGIFSQSGGGCGPGLIQNVAADGSVVLNTSSNSAAPGSFITIYGTGFDRAVPYAFLGIPGFRGGLGESWWWGLAPGLVGVNQVNVLLLDDAPEGCTVPVRVAGWWTQSPPVTISVRRGGGPCQDAPPARFAALQWRKLTTTSYESPSGVAEATFTASFASAPENLAVPFPDPPDPPSRECRCGGLSTPIGPRCRSAGLTALDAGAMTLAGVPGGPLTLRPSPPGEDTGYKVALPPGSLEGGTLRVTGAGGADVGTFETDVTLPPPIQVTTSLAPGTVIDVRRPLSVAWTAGSSDAVVGMRLIAYHDQEGIFGSSCYCQVLASEGKAELGLGQNKEGEVMLLIFARSENAEVVLTVTPRTSKLTRFAAPGLTREGRHEWSYEYRFKGLKIR